MFVETDDCREPSSRCDADSRARTTARVTSDLGLRALTPAEARNRGALFAASATCPDAGDEALELMLAARRCFDLGGDHIRADAVAGELLALKLRAGSSEEAGVRLVTKLLRLGAIEAAIREAKRYGAAGHLVALELAAKFLPGEEGDKAVLELRGYRVKAAVAVANYALTTAAAAGLGVRSCLADLRLRIRSEMAFSIASRALDATGGAATTALRAAAAVRRLAACDDALAAVPGRERTVAPACTARRAPAAGRREAAWDGALAAPLARGPRRGAGHVRGVARSPRAPKPVPGARTTCPWSRRSSRRPKRSGGRRSRPSRVGWTSSEATALRPWSSRTSNSARSAWRTSTAKSFAR